MPTLSPAGRPGVSFVSIMGDGGPLMPKPKKKLLPKDFDALLKAGDMAALKAVFDACELDARGDPGKRTALAFLSCPDELTRWLVEKGADIEARDTYGCTPLHARSTSLGGDIATLLELGADIHATDQKGDTPLHKAARFANTAAVRQLLDLGARADALNATKMTPLAAGLQYCSNAQIAPMAAIAEQLLAAETPRKKGLGDLIMSAFSGKPLQPAGVTVEAQAFVQRIGKEFEFHRQGFNPDYVAETSAGLDRLYALFNVPPVPRRVVHDGRAPIVAKSPRWQDQHQELWVLLVPSNGAAATVQGEVIRITGRITSEVDHNGAVNWDAGYRKMGSAFLAHIASGVPLSDADRERAAQLVARVREQDGAGPDLCELAVRWVRLNPTPAPLAPPDHDR